MSEEKVSWLVCKPKDWLGDEVPGSIIDKCTKCGHEVWVKPANRVLAEVICAVCVREVMDKLSEKDREDLHVEMANEALKRISESN